MTRIIITVSGGVLQEVISDHPVSVGLIDYDDVGRRFTIWDKGLLFEASVLRPEDFDANYAKMMADVNAIIQKNIDEEKANARP